MSIIDGTTTTLNCGIHNFSTQDMKEWEAHLREAGHYASGASNCAICGQEYTYTLDDKVPSMVAQKGLASHPACRGTT